MNVPALIDVLANAGANAKLVISSELAPPISVPLASLLDTKPGAAAAVAKLARPRVALQDASGRDVELAAPYGAPRDGAWMFKTGAVVVALVVAGVIIGRTLR